MTATLYIQQNVQDWADIYLNVRRYSVGTLWLDMGVHKYHDERMLLGPCGVVIIMPVYILHKPEIFRVLNG